MDELETQREALPPGEARWGAFHAASELFAEAIDLGFETGDVSGAFEAAERRHARTLLDAYGIAPSSEPARLSAGTVAVEYAVLPSRLIIFVVDSSGVHAIATSTTAESLRVEGDALAGALRADDEVAVQRVALSLYRRLVQPVEARLLGAARVVFVPDGPLTMLPFSAFRDERGELLLERCPLVVAPSVAAFAAAAERRRQAPPPQSVLIAANAEAGADIGRLGYVEAEAGKIARSYASAVRLPDDGAQHDELTRRAPEADVVHFGGHAVGDESGLVPAAIVLRQNGEQRNIGPAEIAKLRIRPTATVVLAGCNTARAEHRSAEGVVSVAHGFLMAGASSVIATLWPIDDHAAAIFFPRLHARLAAGVPPAEALREVQLESKRRGDVPASLWAAVRAIGS